MNCCAFFKVGQTETDLKSRKINASNFILLRITESNYGILILAVKVKVKIFFCNVFRKHDYDLDPIVDKCLQLNNLSSSSITQYDWQPLIKGEPANLLIKSKVIHFLLSQ